METIRPEFVDAEQRAAYIAGLKVELASSHQNRDKTHELAVLAELERLDGAPKQSRPRRGSDVETR